MIRIVKSCTATKFLYPKNDRIDPIERECRIAKGRLIEGTLIEAEEDAEAQVDIINLPNGNMVLIPSGCAIEEEDPEDKEEDE